MWFSILMSAVIIADAYMQVHGYKPFMFTWTKADNKEMPSDQTEANKSRSI